jgi:hypothetical protein
MDNELPENYRRMIAAQQPPRDVFRDRQHEHYHSWQADCALETAAKKLARRTQMNIVRCPCGAEFPSRVEGQVDETISETRPVSPSVAQP